MAQEIRKHRIATKRLTKHRRRDDFILFGSLLEAVVAIDAICNYSAELQKRVKLINYLSALGNLIFNYFFNLHSTLLF